jgi:ribosomal peptide maturation radical SAM protein 1
MPDGEAGTSRDVDVYLVCMPYAAIQRPSLALGVLKASLAGTGIRCAVQYANLDFAARFGLETLSLLFFQRTDSLIGEWTFAGAAFPERESSVDDIVGQAGRYQPASYPRTAVGDRQFASVFQYLRDAAPDFVDSVARRILARGPRIVGCTSTFEQHCASLALLRRIKELDPTVVTMIGGANCEAEMGWAAIRAFPWLDFVVSGEAEHLFPTLCRLALDRGATIPLEELPDGVMSAAHVEARYFGPGLHRVPRATVENMDSVPVPDYSDWIEQLNASPYRSQIRPGLLIETSRGCWWGQKLQCTFCGLNGEGMVYRSKSAERVLSEVAELVKSNGISQFSVADNILDMQHFKTVLPELARQGAPYRFFYETKSNLRRDQMRLMAQAGIMQIQPGIESLNDNTLKLMDKGNTAIINIQTLRYAREFGVYVMWLMMVGLPGEDEAWHAEVAEWLPLVAHLQPPNSMVHVRFDRFSVYHQRQFKFDLRLTPYPSYGVVYPVSKAILNDLAYFFVDERTPPYPSPSRGAQLLGEAVSDWKSGYWKDPRPIFSMTERGEEIDFYDTRPCAPERRVTIAGLEAEIYRAVDTALTPDEIALRLQRDAGEVGAALTSLAARKLVVVLNGKFLALAVTGELPTAFEPEELPGGWVNHYDTQRFSSLNEAWRHLIAKSRAAQIGIEKEREAEIQA